MEERNFQENNPWANLSTVKNFDQGTRIFKLLLFIRQVVKQFIFGFQDRNHLQPDV